MAYLSHMCLNPLEILSTKDIVSPTAESDTFLPCSSVPVISLELVPFRRLNLCKKSDTTQVYK